MALHISSELAAQKCLIQESNSWAQRLTNLLSWCVADEAHGLEKLTLSLLQLSVASSCRACGSSRQDMDDRQADNRYHNAAE